MEIYEVRSRLENGQDNHCGYYINKFAAILSIIEKLQPVRKRTDSTLIYTGGITLNYVRNNDLEFKTIGEVISFLKNPENMDTRNVNCTDGSNYILVHETKD